MHPTTRKPPEAKTAGFVELILPALEFQKSNAWPKISSLGPPPNGGTGTRTQGGQRWGQGERETYGKFISPKMCETTWGLGILGEKMGGGEEIWICLRAKGVPTQSTSSKFHVVSIGQHWNYGKRTWSFTTRLRWIYPKTPASSTGWHSFLRTQSKHPCKKWNLTLPCVRADPPCRLSISASSDPQSISFDCATGGGHQNCLHAEGIDVGKWWNGRKL